jgi:hypothetical protein
MEGEHFVDVIKFTLFMLVFENPFISMLLVAWVVLYTLFVWIPDEFEAWRKDRMARKEMEIRIKEIVRLQRLEIKENERKNRTP